MRHKRICRELCRNYGLKSRNFPVTSSSGLRPPLSWSAFATFTETAPRVIYISLRINYSQLFTRTYCTLYCYIVFCWYHSCKKWWWWWSR